MKLAETNYFLSRFSAALLLSFIFLCAYTVAASMPGFGFSVGDVIATVELIRKIVSGLKSTTGAAAQYQRTIIELESLNRLLHYIQRLSSETSNEDASRLDSIRAAAFATSLTLNDFLRKFQKYEESLAPTTQKNKVQRAAKAVQYTLSMNEDVERLQLYISAQLLSINTLLQLLDRDTARQRDIMDDRRHEEIVTSMSRHTTAIEDFDQRMVPITTNIAQSRQEVETLAKTSLKNTRILLDLHRNISKCPAFTGADSINFTDALGRPFPLPFTYFSKWELFESFVKQAFAGVDIPGRHQVQGGNFVISTASSESQTITKSNWDSKIHPGATLRMTVVFSMLKMQFGCCPRSSCGATLSVPHKTGYFMTCPNCGLIFCHNSDLQTLGLLTEDDKLRQIQEVEDLTSFGRRSTPADVVEIQSEDEETPSPQSPAIQIPIHPDLAQPAQALSMQNLAILHETAAEPSKLGAQPDLQETKLSSIDWNSGTSAMAAWLNASALPSTDLPPNADNDPVKAEVEQLRQERKDLEALKRVHFTSTAPETQPLRDKVKEYKDMPLDAQVHVRKVVDRFPNLPAYLAKRFANSNVSRMNRLRKGRLDRGSEPGFDNSLEFKLKLGNMLARQLWRERECDY